MSISKEKMLHLSDALIKQTIRPLQDIQSLILFSRVSNRFSRLLSPHCGVAAELLFCVLNINPARKKRILKMLAQTKEGSESIILMRTAGQEFYYNTKICKKEWADVSPLEAAAKCGDNHTVRLLLDSVPMTERDKAIKQLAGVKASRTIAYEPGSYIYPLVELRKAYKYFLDPLEVLLAGNFKENIKEINKRCGLLGDAIKNLSWFLLQTFCDPKPYGQLKFDFTQEPARECIVLNKSWVEVPLDITLIGGSTERALCKGERHVRFAAGISCAVGMDCGGSGLCDANAMDSLYETLPSELDKIIASPPPEREIESQKQGVSCLVS